MKRAIRARYLHRITEVRRSSAKRDHRLRLSRMGCAQRELFSAGFTQAEGAERLLAWRLASHGSVAPYL
jgi:hypothetical protein